MFTNGIAVEQAISFDVTRITVQRALEEASTPQMRSYAEYSNPDLPQFSQQTKEALVAEGKILMYLSGRTLWDHIRCR